MSEWPYVIAAYSVAWCVTIGYAWYLWARERAASRDNAVGGP